MKKLFFIAAIAGAALVSCTKNELAPSATEQHEITFASPVVGVQTKVLGAIGTEYSTDESFEVWSVYNTTDIQAWGGTTYFSDVPAEFDATANGWGLTPKYFWPANGKLSFVALSPALGADFVTNYTEDTGFTINNWSQGASEAAIVDLMYSNVSWNNAKEDFGANSEELNDKDKNPYTGVDITFKHALSYLVFKITTEDDYSQSTRFQLDKITLSGIYNKGSFKQKATDPWTENTTGGTGTYVAFEAGRTAQDANGKNITFAPIEFTEAAKNAKPADVSETIGKEIILLPQALVDKQQKITIAYRISTDGGKTWIDQVQEGYFYINNDTAVKAWEMGKKYTYTITIGTDEIIFDPAVTEWDADINGDKKVDKDDESNITL